jgi:proton-translocating NAD(P)+ transhydrogenase subunit alpha
MVQVNHAENITRLKPGENEKGFAQSPVVTGIMSSTTLIASLYVFALAAFLGYQVISRVPPLLHTPLMSATNAISGISLVGSIVTAGAHYNTVSTILGFIAVVCSTTNVVGGFVITDRMLRMFKRKPRKE